MRKFDTKIYTPVGLGLTMVLGTLSIMVSAWFFIGVILTMAGYIYIQNRSIYIEHYCLGVDLDTNGDGDVIEVYMYAFNKFKNHYYPVMSYFKQLRIYVNVRLLDNFYANIGYPVVDDMTYMIRKVAGTDTEDISIAKKRYKEIIAEINRCYALSAGSIRDQNLDQPIQKKVGVGGKLWNWWTFGVFKN